MRLKDRNAIERLLAPNPAAGKLPPGILDLVASNGALLMGHFELMSGDHSEYFLRFSQIGWNREATAQVADALVECTPLDWQAARLLCSDSAGLFLGNAVSQQMKRPLAVTKVDAARRPLPVMREGKMERGDSVIIVNDVVTRGEALERMIALVRDRQANLVGVLAFAAIRPALFADFLRNQHVAATWLLDAMWPVYSAGECPMCAAKKPFLPAVEFN